MKISWYLAVIVRHSIVECRYNAVQYIMILQTSLQEWGQNTNQSQILTSELGVPFVNVDRRNLTAFNSTALYWLTVIHVAFIVSLLTLTYITLVDQISKLQNCHFAQFTILFNWVCFNVTTIISSVNSILFSHTFIRLWFMVHGTLLQSESFSYGLVSMRFLIRFTVSNNDDL